MHPDDQMTPKERQSALKNGDVVDRLPIGMIYGTPSASLLGWSRQYGDSSARRCADRVKKNYEVFGTDGVGISYGLHGLGISYGAMMSDPEFSAPSIIEAPLKNIGDIHQLDLDKLTLNKDSYLKKCYDAVQILVDELGDEVGCGFGLPGIFTGASSLVGPENLLKALRNSPEDVHNLLEFVTMGLLQIASLFLKMNIPVNIADPVASGSMISKKNFEEFVAPYTKRFVSGCKAIKPYGISCHICGNTSRLLESIAACGFSNVDIDNVVSLKDAKERIGDSVHISGNVSPVDVLLRGTPEDVEKDVKRCFQEAWDSPKGFMISTGCDSAWGTPLENSLAFVATARKCAKFPMNPENFK